MRHTFFPGFVLVALAAAAFGFAACGTSSDVASSDGGVADGAVSDGAAGEAASDAPSDAPADAAPDTNGSYACGAATCKTGEYCIHPCGGGALPMCLPEDDAGTCGSGTRSSCFGDAGPTTGCVPAPPPPFCDAKRECPNGMSTVPGSSRDVTCQCA
jgi:hypothetical protein